MPRFALLLAACAALLSACSSYSTPMSKPAQPNGKPVFITLQVESHLNKYYRTIGGGRSGAFAVSDKGTVGFYAYCQAVTCRDEVSFTRTALRGLRSARPCAVHRPRGRPVRPAVLHDLQGSRRERPPRQGQSLGISLVVQRRERHQQSVGPRVVSERDQLRHRGVIARIFGKCGREARAADQQIDIGQFLADSK